MIYQNFFKPVLDFTIAAIFLLVLSPVFLLIFLILLVVNRGSPFFVQTRPGKDGKSFRIIKFKTMRDIRDRKGELLPNSKRITRVGNFLRKTSLDEIPQLINILKGELSLVGPRPLLMQYLPHYSKEQQLRHKVKPGITGWAQVNGRQSIPFIQRFELDVWYVQHISFKLDVIILVRTFINIFKPKGVVVDEIPWKE